MQLVQAESIGLESSGAERSRDDVRAGERALIEAVQRRDPDAFEQLVRLYDRSVLRITMNILRSPEDARDAYQEAFLKVYRNIEKFRFQCSFHTWLYRIATNVCLDHIRRRNVRKEYGVDERGEAYAYSPLQTAVDVRPAGSPDRTLAQREMSARIGGAMEMLSDKERVVFELRHHEGMRLRAIGESLSMSEEAAKNCLFRATKKLREALKDVRS